MSDFNAKIIAKSQKVLDNDKDLQQKILDECSKSDESVSPDEHAKNVLDALFRIQQIRPEYLASKNDLSDKIFESPEALEAFLSALKEFKDVEKRVLFSEETVDKEILNLDANAMFLNPSKIEEAKSIAPDDFVVGKEKNDDRKQDPELSANKVMESTEVSDEEVEKSPEIIFKEIETPETPEAAPEETNTIDNSNDNFPEEADFEGASNKEVKEKLSSAKLKEEKTLLMKDLLKDCTYNKKHKIFVDNETGKPFIRIEGFSWQSYLLMSSKDKQYNSVTRASAGHNPSVEAMKSVMKMVEPKVIRTFPTDNLEENEAKFRKALEEMRDEGFDLNEISIGVMLNRKNPELKKILEDVKNPTQEFKVGLSNEENLKEKLKGEKAAAANDQKPEETPTAPKNAKPEESTAPENKSENKPAQESSSKKANATPSQQAPQNSENHNSAMQNDVPDYNESDFPPPMTDADYASYSHYDNEPPMHNERPMYNEPPMYGDDPSMGMSENNGQTLSKDVLPFDELMAASSDDFLAHGIKTRFGTYTPEQELEIGKRVIDIAEEKNTTILELVSPQNENKETQNLDEAMSNVLLKGMGDYKLHLKKLQKSSIENQENDLKQEVESELSENKNKQNSENKQSKKNRKNNPRK